MVMANAILTEAKAIRKFDDPCCDAKEYDLEISDT
jgi:hypothetical protein